MSALNKKTKSIVYVNKSVAIFHCPLCASSMQIVDNASLRCAHHHTFDFAKQGYINLLTHPLKTKYDKKLFASRRKLIVESGLFAPLTQTIAELIINNKNQGQVITHMLDAGCGEGSHLTTICDQVCSHLKRPIVGVGIDIAKEGIAIAAQNYANKIWCVADLAHAPFKEKQFDVLLTILSPSNYAECQRLLRDDGMIVKVVPQSGYLTELRNAFFAEPKKQSYSNTATVERFYDNFEVLETRRLYYGVTLDNVMIASLLDMTPLTWTAPEEKIQAFLEKDTAQITIDVDILIARKISDIV
ncbi:putative RNA methyltransferase [Aneurinibacillus sp. REN35]|uniref:putative RNA methyltransferase n=1 Tax=Aneurinibacillus sp. REN35 TaxID=3237286 RepID=UPI0035296230